MDRAFGFGPKGCRFESCRGHSVTDEKTSDGGSIPSESTNKTKKSRLLKRDFFVVSKSPPESSLLLSVREKEDIPKFPMRFLMLLGTLVQQLKHFLKSISLKLHLRIPRQPIFLLLIGAPAKKVETPIPREHANSHDSQEENKKNYMALVRPPKSDFTNNRSRRYPLCL